MKKQRNVIFGFLGTVLDAGNDAGNDAGRWSRWRPSVSLFAQEDFLVDRFHLIYGTRSTSMAKTVKADIASISPATKLVDHVVDFRNPWDFEEMYEKLLDLVEEQKFDTDNEEYLFHITTGTHVAQICIFLLAESRKFPGKLLQSSPEKERVKSFHGSLSIIDLDLSKYDRITSRFLKESQDDVDFLKSGIETQNARFNALMERIERVAIRSKEPILLTGPTGAGKSRLAKRIFELKKQRTDLAGSFVEVNCATLRGDAAMSNLFGHVKGSFTGAVADRKGFLKQADRGVLFLDEIGELGLDEQAMLLHAIEEKTYFSVGSDVKTSSDFVLICGTNRNLSKAVDEGKFRDDLLARINLWTFELLGLKDRKEDILPNVEFELADYERASGVSVRFNKEAIEAFLTFAQSSQALWKANFRDLNGAIKRLCTLASSARITLVDVELEIERLKKQWGVEIEEASSISAHSAIDSVALSEPIDLFDRITLEGVVQICRTSPTMAEAGRSLFAVSRLEKTSVNDSDRIKKYLARFGLTWETVRGFR